MRAYTGSDGPEGGLADEGAEVGVPFPPELPRTDTHESAGRAA